jgi:hypothetical protein
MNLEIRSVEAAGDLERERLVLRATTNANIGLFAVFRCESQDNDEVSSGPVPDAYWFEDKKVKENDLVVLYTKAGTISEKVSSSGATSHFFYWGLDTPIWVPAHTPLLVNTTTWRFGTSIR